MLNKITVGLLLLAIVGYGASIAVGDPFVYILCFVFLVLVVLFGLFVLAANLAWRLLPSRLKKTHEIKRGRFNTTILLSVPLAFIVADAISDEYLAESSRLISVLGNTAIVVFAGFAAWSFIKCSRWRMIFAGGGIFVIFIALLSFAGSVVPESSEAASTDSVDKLKSLGYVEWVPAETEDSSGKIKTGVTVYDPNLAFDGLNLFTSRRQTEAYLINMRGDVVHKWAKRTNEGELRGHVEMCRNGDLLVFGNDTLARLDWDSNVQWKTNLRVHHDVSIDENQQIYTIAGEDMLVFWHGIPVPILSDCIAVLTPWGEVKKKVYLYDLVRDHISAYRIIKIYRAILEWGNLKTIFRRWQRLRYICRGDDWFDVLHANSIEIMPVDIEGFCRKGDWLISIREISLVAVLDPEKQEFTWRWGPRELDNQHHPTLLENGNVLIFDNGRYRGFSRVVELEPLTKEIVWEYKSDPPEQFFSERRGSCQRLPNGNTLIAESDKGRVFEIASDGRIVWEFFNPDIKENAKKRRVICRMLRITYPVKL